MSKPEKKKTVSKKRTRKKRGPKKPAAQKKTATAETPLPAVSVSGIHFQDTLLTMTFYSFKGGVGRTLALLNVATLLAKLGNRVAIADFDLEAPGLDTYEGFKPPVDNQPGVLEFITDYTQSEGLRAPSCKNYVYCAFDQGIHRWDDEQFGPPKKENAYFGDIEGNGALYVMRAGRQDAAYRRNLTRLDWDKLFAEQDGHLLFANLKNELFNDYGCNFLLLDSRTGLTDVAGVCTAYLPDAVVLMFYPDEQNTRGIRTVAKAIRAFDEKEGRRIPRMYCVARVPQIAEVRRQARIRAERVYHDVDYSDAVRQAYPSAKALATSGRWDWDDYLGFMRGNYDYVRSLEHIERGLPYVPYVALKRMATISCLGGYPYLLDVDDWDPEWPRPQFGGLPVCAVRERPSISQDLVAVLGRSHEDCRPYMNLATFGASLNAHERSKLNEATNHIHIPRIKEDEQLNDRQTVSLVAKRRALSAPLNLDPCSSKHASQQIEHAREWHSDLFKHGPAWI